MNYIRVVHSSNKSSLLLNYSIEKMTEGKRVNGLDEKVICGQPNSLVCFALLSCSKLKSLECLQYAQLDSLSNKAIVFIRKTDITCLLSLADQTDAERTLIT